MNESSTNNCASNELASENAAPGPSHSPLVRADRCCAAFAHSGHRLAYSLLLEQGIDAFWLLKIHTGHFGWLNLQPFYPLLLGVLTIVVTGSGVVMLLRPSR